MIHFYLSNITGQVKTAFLYCFSLLQQYSVLAHMNHPQPNIGNLIPPKKMFYCIPLFRLTDGHRKNKSTKACCLMCFNFLLHLLQLQFNFQMKTLEGKRDFPHCGVPHHHHVESLMYYRIITRCSFLCNTYKIHCVRIYILKNNVINRTHYKCRIQIIIQQIY